MKETKSKSVELSGSDDYTFIADLDALIGDVADNTIISRTVYQDKKTKAILFAFAAQQELSEHTASRPAIIHFIKGEATVTVGESSYTARAGSWLHMEANVPHSIVALEPAAMLLLMI